MKPMTRTSNLFRRLARVLLLGSLAAAVTVSEAALLGLTETPLYLSTAVDPNILLTFDDSGSMARAYLPDNYVGGDDERRGCANYYNRLYYDPTITYDAPVDGNGQPLNSTATSFTAAFVDGFNTAFFGPVNRGTVNLSTSYRATWTYNAGTSSFAGCGWSGTTTLSGTGSGTNTNARAAFYFNYNTACGNPNNNLCYDLVQHNNAGAGGAWDATRQQNFANWYSYYRTRNLLAKTSAGRAFSRFGGNVRVSGQHLTNTAAGSGTSLRFTTTIGVMQQFNGTPRNNFFTRLYNSPANGWTPLRQATQRAGQHFELSAASANSPYRDVPGTAGSPERSCRQNFHILFTDGYWNSTAGVAGNIDGTSHADLPDPPATSPYVGINTYTPRPPYTDTTSSTLADNTFSYWYRDLRGDLNNNVRTRVAQANTDKTIEYWDPVNDPANWQHMVTYTIGLGIDGTLTNDTATYNNLVSGAQLWPAACSDCQTAVDDLWHAAINSRGRYFSARDTTALVSAFTAIINDVIDRLSSASSAALNAGALSTDTHIYQSRFNSGDWSGQVISYQIDASTGNVGAQDWDAAAELNRQNYNTGRHIITTKWSTRRGIPFRWPVNPAAPGAGEIDTWQVGDLNFNPVTATTDTNGQARLNYIRGDASNEGTGLNFRVRTRTCTGIGCDANGGFLGDTVNSTPMYVGAPPFSYKFPGYDTFKNNYKNRRPVLYIGSNDGMLHALDISNGQELFAYVPSRVYPNLNQLPANPFAHRYMVDGHQMPGDVEIGGAWRTVLVGSLRKGGQGLYALDVTDPGSFNESSADNMVLWEFTDMDDADLGYSFSEPQIVKMANDRWAVIIGNGYNNSETPLRAGFGQASSTGRGYIYVLFVDKTAGSGWSIGSDYIKIDTGVGSTATPNGVATPAVVDVDGDNKADYIYAGDLQGNLWRIDVRSSTPNNWTVGTNRKLVYAAGTSKPVTSRPVAKLHPAGLPGFMVYFGTGKYLESSDATTVGASTQTFYGIWDNVEGSDNVTTATLLEQTVTSTQTAAGGEFRTVSDNPITWRSGGSGYFGWYLNLPTTGEKVVADAILRGDAVIFTTLIPSNDPCTEGGDGWLMELNANSGGTLGCSPFDVNADGSFCGGDLLTVGGNPTPVSGLRITSGIPSSPAILSGGNPYVSGGSACGGQDCKFISSSDGSIQRIIERMDDPNRFHRQSWRQAR